MTYLDVNIWGIIGMPIGLALCFTPVVIAWFAAKD